MQNQAANYAAGAGIYAGGTPETGSSTTLVNSTVSGNVTNNAGGGIYAAGNATVSLNHCTVTGNTANGDNSAIGGGGITSHAFGIVQLQNSIVANNVDLATVATPSHDFARWTYYPQGTLTSLGGNLIGDSTGSSIFWDTSDQVGDNETPIDPLLAALALNAPGNSPTHALLTGSPAINTAPSCEAATDQRGITRPQGSSCDIGAYEEDNIRYLTMAISPAEGGTTTPSVGGYTYAQDSVIPITATPAEGYEFSHWTPDDTPGVSIANPYEASTTVTMDADYTVTAHFAPIVHTLTVNTVGNGTVTKDPDIVGPYNYGTEVELTAIPDSGWLFDGWSGDLSGLNNPETITMDADKSVTATFTVYHTVTFNANGGTGTMAPQTANVPAALMPNSFTRTGYTFSGWNTVAGGGGTAYADGATYDFSADITLYAQWTALPDHTVTFNANGGTGTMAPQTANVPAALMPNSFTRTGYTFSGWNTVAGGGGTAYADGATYDFSADMDLYAQWTANTYTVTFDANGGTGTMAPQTTNVATALTLNSFTRTDYTFSGWNTVAGGGGTAYADGATYDFSADTTLYAQWTINTAVMSVSDITLTPKVGPKDNTITGLVTIVDSLGTLLSKAAVTVNWYQDGTLIPMRTSPTSITKHSGVAKFVLRKMPAGTYRLCVVNVVKDGYDDWDFVTPCATLMVP